MNKSITLIILILIGLGIGLYIYQNSNGNNGVETPVGQNDEQGTQVPGTTATSTEYTDTGIYFMYKSGPDAYTLITKADKVQDHDEYIKSIVIMNTKEYQELLASDAPRSGPPSISVTIVKKTDNSTVRDWVMNNKFWSLFEGASSTLKNGHIQGNPAVRYDADGLYPSDMIVAEYDSKIYIISGSYNEKSDRIYQDYLAFVDSIGFGSKENITITP